MATDGEITNIFFSGNNNPFKEMVAQLGERLSLLLKKTGTTSAMTRILTGTTTRR
jgi:hypothetical protein